MTRVVFALLMGWLLVPLAAAQRYPTSDAHRLYTAFRVAMASYNGFHQDRLPALLEKYDQTLRGGCEKQAHCSSRDAGQQIERLIQDLQDDHTFLEDPWGLSQQSTPQQALEDALGVRVVNRLEGWYVAFILHGSEAQRSGLQMGDLILAAGGQDVDSAPRNWKLDFKAHPTLLIERQGQRQRLRVNTRFQRDYWQKATYRLVEDTAIVQIPTFQHDTADPERLPITESLGRVLQALQEQNITHLVLDLRYNGGGWMDECTAASTSFVPRIQLFEDEKHLSRRVVAWSGHVQAWIAPKFLRGVLWQEAHLKTSKNIFWENKVVVLVNHDTASCGEWFTYQLQRNGKATVVGEPTYGLLNTSSLYQPLALGYHLQFTVIRSLHEDFSPYPGHITPDVLVRNSLTEDLQLQKALELIHRP